VADNLPASRPRRLAFGGTEAPHIFKALREMSQLPITSRSASNPHFGHLKTLCPFGLRFSPTYRAQGGGKSRINENDFYSPQFSLVLDNGLEFAKTPPVKPAVQFSRIFNRIPDFSQILKSEPTVFPSADNPVR